MVKGQRFEEVFNVSGDVYQGFINLFNDRNPLHTDTAFAQSKGFKGVVMHGNILNGFLSYFIGECLPDKNVIIHHQSINYSLPVYVDDILTFSACVDDYFDSVKAYHFSFYFQNADGKKVAKGKFQIGLLT
jgi:3-hydroxybutyryl-CoA dehydratase